jgi:hypothetical protein
MTRMVKVGDIVSGLTRPWLSVSLSLSLVADVFLLAAAATHH